MAVTGVFTADFSSFDKAVQTSTKNLEGLETGAEKTNSSLRLMSQTQEQMLDKIGASGGKIQDLGTAATTTAGDVNTLNTSYRQFDGLLQAAGINIGPQVKGLEDLAGAAGKTTTELGLLGTAGAVVGTALAAWKIGTWIGEITGATQAIEDLTAKMMGLGNLAAETAGAKQDVINRAIAQGAKETIGYTEAIKFNTEAGKKNADQKIDWRDKLADAHREVRNLTDAQKAEIAIAQEAGATTEQLTNKYGISAQGLKVLAEDTDRAAAAQARLTAEHEKAAAAAEKLDREYAKLMSDTKNANQLAIMEADAANQSAAATQKKLEAGSGWVKMMGEASRVQEEQLALTAGLEGAQLRVAQENAAIVQGWHDQQAAAEAATTVATEGIQEATAAQAGYVTQIELTSDGIRGWIELMKFTNANNALLNQNSLFTTTSTLENQARLGTAFSPIPGFAGGIENFGGGLAKVHGGEVLANLPAGTSVYPKGSGLGATISNVFNLVDSESNLARRVSDLIMRQVRAGTQLGTA